MKRFCLLIAVLMSALVLGADLPAEVTVSYNGTAGVTPKLPLGRKLIRCSTDCYYVFNSTNVANASSASIPLSANQVWEVQVIEGFRYISFVQQTASGTAYVYPVVTK